MIYKEFDAVRRKCYFGIWANRSTLRRRVRYPCLHSCRMLSGNSVTLSGIWTMKHWPEETRWIQNATSCFWVSIDIRRRTQRSVNYSVWVSRIYTFWSNQRNGNNDSKIPSNFDDSRDENIRQCMYFREHDDKWGSIEIIQRIMPIVWWQWIEDFH